MEKKKKILRKLMYLLLLFVVGSLAGWIYETVFYFIEEGGFSNRGVLFGPWIPIYGIGAICLYYLKPLKKHPVLLFLSCMIITGIVEYVIGYTGREFFDMKLWDYDGLFLNISGIVCLRSVLSFAVGGVVFHYLLEPFLEKKFNKLTFKTTSIYSIIFICIFIIDIILSCLFRNPPTY